MKRRQFLQATALGAVAVSTTGFVRFNGQAYEGDCETTTDILGPYYRPDAPLRTNLLISGAPGQQVVLKGQVKHKDCLTPYQGAKVEIWHCGADGVYDNASPDFRYRATTFCDDKGRYEFLTVLPVPYDVGSGQFRPAHFHMLVSAPGYQSLVTQLYFTGDPHLADDPSSASPAAKRRILNVTSTPEGRKLVSFDVTMAEKLEAHPTAIDRLTGSYVFENDKTRKLEFLNRDGQLWLKYGDVVYGVNCEYMGNNTFALAGPTPDRTRTFAFELMKGDAVKLITTSPGKNGQKTTEIAYRSR